MALGRAVGWLRLATLRWLRRGPRRWLRRQDAPVTEAAGSFDAVVVGGGPNGLICAAYLARSGAKVALLERRHETGGGLNTDEYFGFRFNLHAIYQMMADVMPAYRDLDLESYGLRYVRPPYGGAFLFSDGGSLLLSSDSEASAAEIDKLSPADGACYRAMAADFQAMLDGYLIPLTYEPPTPPLEQLEMMERDEAGQKLSYVSEMSFVDILGEYGFSDPRVRMALLSFPAMWGLALDEPLGFLFPLYLTRMLQASIVKGGSHRLSSAIYRALAGAGGTIRDASEVSRIVIEGGAVQGVETANGALYKAPLVISTLNPEQTFVDLAGRENLSPELAERVDAWEWESRSLFGLHLGVTGSPSYKTADKRTEDALIAFMGIETDDQLLEHLARVDSRDETEAAWLHVTVPTRFDPSQAPPGHSVVRIETVTSYHLPWDTISDSYATSCLDLLRRYVDLGDILIEKQCPPTYIEKRLTTMKQGSIKHGEYSPLQLGYFRPNDLCSGVETPIDGLLVAGASVYPGGMVIGGPGYLGAKVALAHLGRA